MQQVYDWKKIREGIEQLKAAKSEPNPTYPDLPEAPPIPKSADDTAAVGVKRTRNR